MKFLVSIEIYSQGSGQYDAHARSSDIVIQKCALKLSLNIKKLKLDNNIYECELRPNLAINHFSNVQANSCEG